VSDPDPNRTVDTCEASLLSFESDHVTDFCELSVGSLATFDRFVALSRFKLWWMFPQVGKVGSTIPGETQLLLLEYQSCGLYVAIVPTARETYRSVITESNTELKVQINTGSRESQLDYWESALCISVAESPYDAIRYAVLGVKSVCKEPGFQTRYEKPVPSTANLFGWCTWDAFYHKVAPAGIEKGLETFERGGVVPKWLIIDDGWQTVVRALPFSTSISRFIADMWIRWTPNALKNALAKWVPKVVSSLYLMSSDLAHFCYRLKSVKANSKFSSLLDKGQTASCFTEDSKDGFKSVIKRIRGRFNLDKIYCWHSMTGYWGGICDQSEETKKYKPSIKAWKLTKSIVENQPTLLHDALLVNGVGVPATPVEISNLHNDMHHYLSQSGVDGVKVDVQSSTGPLGESFGSSTYLARMYHKSLEKSVRKHFDSHCIACMCHSSDDLFSLYNSPICRASDDFFPEEPASHAAHLMAVSFNSLLIGEIAICDWDMFITYHKYGELHAACRAVGGCPVYVSDVPGNQDFSILESLVLEDGTILRAHLPGRPTRDCLFCDVIEDRASVLKIWNWNSFGGVIGAFNVQGSGWDKLEQKFFRQKVDNDGRLEFAIMPRDAELHDTGDRFVVYSHKKQQVSVQEHDQSVKDSLELMSFEIYTVVPLSICNDVCFAPIGLGEMLNGAAVIRSVKALSIDADAKTQVEVKLAPCVERTFLLYSTLKPDACYNLEDNGQKVELDFLYSENCLVSVPLLSESKLLIFEYYKRV
jgi:raffinose synthase